MGAQRTLDNSNTPRNAAAKRSDNTSAPVTATDRARAKDRRGA